MTTTPNPTAEQIVADAITAYWADEERSGPNRGPLAHDFACGEAATAALRAHGLLSEGAPTEDDREALIDVVKRNRSVVKRMSDGYPSVALVTDETIADAILAAGFSRAAVPDAREHLHAKCDCVPNLGPAHCHLCSADGSPVEWANCVAVQQVTDAPETVEVAFKTVEVERLGHLLVQLSPATPRNGAATVRRLMEEMNIKEVVS